MKHTFFIPLGICLAVANCHAAPQPVTKVLLAQADTSKIVQVKAGTLKTANASWWGFDKEDATDCLQNAINSGVSKLIVDNVGSDWIINKSIKLASDQEIVFADGVVVQAKEDCFHGRNESLFVGTKLTNLTMQGEGNAILRMRKKDYQDPAKYSRAEWRMGISLIDCTNVVIRNFTVSETGGDGLYLGATADGYNKNVLVEDMNFDANHRLGMAVISAEDLMIRRCKFNNTLGTGPNGGIDFEPNHPGQRLVNCVVEDSEFNNNVAGTGIDIYAANLNGDSKPMSITFNRCTIKGNVRGMQFTYAYLKSINNPVRGKVIMNDCHFDHDAIKLVNATTNSASLLFKNCTIDFSPNSKKRKWAVVPIEFTTIVPIEESKIGGVTFDHTTVTVDDKMQPIAIRLGNKAEISDQISGSLLVQKNGKTTPFNFTSFIKEQREYWNMVNTLKPAHVEWDQLHVPDQDATRQENGNFYLQGEFTFLQYAKKGQQITVDLRVKMVYDRPVEVELQDPNGKKLQAYNVPLNNKTFPITFTAEQTGLYRVVRRSTFSQYIDINSSHRGNGLLAEETMKFLKPDGRIYFQVPVGVKSFKIRVSTDSTADVALLDAKGTEVERHDGIGHDLQFFSGKREDASKSELWSLQVSKAVWLVNVTLYDPLIPILSTNPETMLVIKK